MKKAALILLCFSLLTSAGITAYAAETNTAPGTAVIRTTVPQSHKVTVELIGKGSYSLNGSEGAEFEVERLSQPELVITVGTGGRLVGVTENGESVLERVADGKYTLDPIYEDKHIVITIEDPGEPEPEPVPRPAPPKENNPTGGPSPNPGGNPSPDPGGSTSPDPGTAPSPSPGSDPAPAAQADPAPPSGGTGDNPATGILGGVSLGSTALLGALLVFRKRDKDSKDK